MASYYVAEDGIKFLILLLSLPEYGITLAPGLYSAGDRTQDFLHARHCTNQPPSIPTAISFTNNPPSLVVPGKS